MASKRLLLYATDTYKLSSLLLRRVLLTRPTTLTAYGERTRQILLDQSRPASPQVSSTTAVNVAAIKLLEWDRELNLVQYYGVHEYSKRWWTSGSWSLSISNQSTSGGSSTKPSVNRPKQVETSSKTNVARVAFMITSNQRHKLSTELGYTSQDIRSFKPIEALLLLEHGVKKESGDFRVKLKELLKENEILMNTQHQAQRQQPSEKISGDVSANHNESNEDGSKSHSPVQQSLSPEEAEQIHAKPGVALALLSVENDSINQVDEVSYAGEEKSHDVDSRANTDDSKNSSRIPSTETIDASLAAEDTPSPATPSLPAVIDVTTHDSEELHMKPDVAAAKLTSQQTKEQQRQQSFLDNQDDTEEVDEDGPCWYEVIERLPTKPALNTADNKSIQSLLTDANNGEQVIALFPTKAEALECVRIKQSFRSRARDADNDGEGSSDGGFLVRRRKNA